MNRSYIYELLTDEHDIEQRYRYVDATEPEWGLTVCANIRNGLEVRHTEYDQSASPQLVNKVVTYYIPKDI